MAVGPDEDVVADLEGVVGHLAAGEASWREQGAVGADYCAAVYVVSKQCRGAIGENKVYAEYYRPMFIAVEAALSPPSPPSADRSAFRCKSPRMVTPAIITVRPPSMMLGLPSMWALREILLPVS